MLRSVLFESTVGGDVIRKAMMAAALVVASATGQEFRVYSPPGADHEFGNSWSAVMFGTVAGHQSRVQQADANFIGQLLPTVSAIAWRREDGPLASAVARTIDLEVQMAHTDFATFSNDFAANALDAPTVVFPRTVINVPDWTSTPALLEYDLVVPFQQPWSYNEQDALVWDVIVHGSSGGGTYANDWFGVPASMDYGSTLLDLGPGCATSNGAFTMFGQFRSDGSGLELGFGVSGAPSQAGVVVMLGSVWFDAIPVPGLCAPLGADGFLSLPIGNSTSGGVVSEVVFPVAWSAGAASLPFTTQALALDGSQLGIGVALSNSALVNLPRTDGNPGIQCKRTFTQGSTTVPLGSAVSTSAVATRFTL